MSNEIINKITIIIPSLLLGGAEHQTLAQINELIKRSIKVQLIVLSDKLNLIEKVNSKCEVVLLKNPSLLTLNKNALIEILKVEKKS